MSYRLPLATTTGPGVSTVGSGLEIISGTLSTGGDSVEATLPQVTTSADGVTVIDSMTLTPGAGTYRVFFNANFNIASQPVDITAQAAAQVDDLYTELTGLTPTGTHPPAFGLGETITPGVYDVASAATISGTLTLDGLGSTTSLFVFRIAGDLTTLDPTNIVLTNGALSSNVFWLAEGDVNIASNNNFSGTAFAHNGDINVGIGTSINGRILSNLGNINTESDGMSTPNNPSVIPLALVLSTFVVFTSIGNLTNLNGGTFLGNVGTNSGTITGYDLPTTVALGGIYFPGRTGPGPVGVTFSVYVDGTLISTSSRVFQSIISIPEITATLLTTAIVGSGQTLDIRSLVTEGTLSVINRNLTIFLA